MAGRAGWAGLGRGQALGGGGLGRPWAKKGAWGPGQAQFLAQGLPGPGPRPAQPALPATGDNPRDNHRDTHRDAHRDTHRDTYRDT